MSIRPLKIGTLELKHNLIQAPLAGISSAAFRVLFSRFERPAYAATEMISSLDLLGRKKLDSRYIQRFKNEGLLCYQLSGKCPNVLAEAVALVDSLGADLIDLNCGCPKSKIRTKGCGSAHLDNPKRLRELVSAMRSATKLPLTVKIRTSGSQDDNAYIDAAKVIQDCGADALIVHGRHWRDGYEINNNHAQIALVKKNLSIPVIANGDIDSLEELNKCFEETGADGAMIGRGAIGRPWIFSELLGTFEGVSFREKLQCFNQHITDLIMLEKSEYIALLQARRFLKHYFINEISKDDLTSFYQFDTLNELLASIEKYEAKK